MDYPVDKEVVQHRGVFGPSRLGIMFRVYRLWKVNFAASNKDVWLLLKTLEFVVEDAQFFSMKRTERLAQER